MKEIRGRGRPRTFDRDVALEAAMELFWARGYEATSLADLTGALGIAPASLYAAFGSKEELFYEAVARYGEKYGAFDPDDAKDVRGTRDFVERLLHGAAKAFTVAGKPRGCMVISAATNCGPESATVELAMRKQRISNEKALAARLARGVSEGDLPKSTDARALAKYIATVFQGMSVQARDGATREELLEVADAALSFFPSEKKLNRRGSS